MRCCEGNRNLCCHMVEDLVMRFCYVFGSKINAKSYFWSIRLAFYSSSLVLELVTECTHCYEVIYASGSGLSFKSIVCDGDVERL